MLKESKIPDDDNIPYNNWFRDIYVNRVIKAWKNREDHPEDTAQANR